MSQKHTFNNTDHDRDLISSHLNIILMKCESTLLSSPLPFIIFSSKSLIFSYISMKMSEKWDDSPTWVMTHCTLCSSSRTDISSSLIQHSISGWSRIQSSSDPPPLSPHTPHSEITHLFPLVQFFLCWYLTSKRWQKNIDDDDNNDGMQIVNKIVSQGIK